MMHEMVHLYNIAQNVQDCSRSGMYHNKHFKEEAEKRALHIDHDDSYGWTITSPTEELIDYIIAQGWTEVEMCRGRGWTPPPSTGTKAGNGTDTAGTEAPKKSSTRKYTCPKCGLKIRATKSVNVICADCMERMIEVE